MMIVSLTQEFSGDVGNKFDFLASDYKGVKDYFHHKTYGDDLEVLYIGLFCMHPKYDSFFKPRKTKYQRDSSTYIHSGVQVERPAKSLSYELRLNFQEYLESDSIKPLLARDILNSLDVIKTVKKIKSFDLDSFRKDFEEFFKMNGWLG